MSTVDLAALLSKTSVILLDFDGPICSLFARYPAPTIAAELRSLLADQGVALTDGLAGEQDPLEILRYTAAIGRPDLTQKIDDALCASELSAACCAEPTPFARELIVAAHHTGRRIAVVSNNSTTACDAYLTARRLRQYIHPIIGRAYANPSQMKPNPMPVLKCLEELRVPPEACILVGDSVSDIEAAHSSQVPAIGFANKKKKITRLTAADAIVSSIEALVMALAFEEL